MKRKSDVTTEWRRAAMVLLLIGILSLGILAAGCSDDSDGSGGTGGSDGSGHVTVTQRLAETAYRIREEIINRITGGKSRKITVKMTNQDALDAACEWGIMIAEDDDFAYGTGKRAHRYGCYYCGTNTGPNKCLKGLEPDEDGHTYEKTYCCNPFVHACFAHGAGDPAMLEACKRGGGISMSAKSFLRYGCWEEAGKPDYDELRRGDVLVRRTHVALYVGDGKIVHARKEGWGSDSILVQKISRASYEKRWNFVMRYTGCGSGTREIEIEPPQSQDG